MGLDAIDGGHIGRPGIAVADIASPTLIAMTTDVLEDLTPEELLRYIGRATDGSDVTKDEVAEFLRAGHDRKTEARVLGWLSRVAKRAKKALLVGEPDAEVVVRAAHRGRVTGFSLVCVGCGTVADKLASSRRSAELAAVGHLRTDHDSVGSIRVL